MPALGNGGGEAGGVVAVVDDAPAVVAPDGGGVGEAGGVAEGDAAAFFIGQKQAAAFVPDGDAVVFVFGTAAPRFFKAVFDFGQEDGFPVGLAFGVVFVFIVGIVVVFVVFDVDIGQGAGEFAHLAVGRFVELVQGEGEGNGVGDEPDGKQAARQIVEQAGADGGFGWQGFEKGHGVLSAVGGFRRPLYR